MSQRTKQDAINFTKTVKSAPVKAFKYNCLHAYKNTPYTVVIDWLQYTCRFNTTFMNMGVDFTHKDYRWLHMGATKHYKHLYHVYQANTHLFTVQITPHKGKDERIGLVKFENFLLYGDWYAYHQDFTRVYVDDIVRISRLDIALDGMTHIRDLIAECTSGREHDYKMIGKTDINSIKLNRRTGKAQGYTIGSIKGHKRAVIYNKTKELAKGNKPYIPDYWRRNGLQQKEDVYRFECRMKSGFLGRVLNANGEHYTPASFIHELRSDALKISVVDLFLKGFFEFIYKDDTNVSRCTRVQIIPKATFKHHKSPLEKKPTNYKARLTIHNLYMQLCSGHGSPEDAIGVMAEQLAYYDLHDWYASKIQDYNRLYVDVTGTMKPVLHSLVGLKPKTSIGTQDEDMIHDRLHVMYEPIPDLSFDWRSRSQATKDPYLCLK